MTFPAFNRPHRFFSPVDLCVFLAYVLGLGLYTYPLVTDLSLPFAPMGDYILITYGLSWQWHALLSDPLSFFHANVMYPADNALAIATPLNTSQLIFFAPALILSNDPIVAINAVYLGNILATALTCYYLFRRYGAPRDAAFLGGWIFAFALGKILQSFQFPFFWMVWVFHFWHQFLLQLRWRVAICTAVAFVLMSLGSFYLMFMSFVGLFFWTVGFHWKIRSLFTALFIRRAALSALLACILILPFGLPYFSVSQTYGLKRPMGEVVQYSADPMATYLLPDNRSVLYDQLSWGRDYAPLPAEETLFAGAAGLIRKTAGNSVFGGRYSDGITYRDFHSIWIAGHQERRLFLGYSVLLLVALGLWVKPPSDRVGERFLLGLLLLSMVVVSLGPVVVILGHLTYLPGPYALFYYLVPGLKGMRATARFGYVAMMAASALAVYGWWYVRRSVVPLWSRPQLSATFRTGALLFLWLGWFTLENLPAQRILFERPPQPSKVYEWLAEYPVEGGVIELPTFKGSMGKDDPVYSDRRVLYANREYVYMYNSTHHWKPIYNGFGAFISPFQFRIRDAVAALPNRDAVEFLKEHKLRILLLHHGLFEQEDRVFWASPAVRSILKTLAYIDGVEVCMLR